MQAARNGQHSRVGGRAGGPTGEAAASLPTRAHWDRKGPEEDSPRVSTSISKRQCIATHHEEPHQCHGDCVADEVRHQPDDELQSGREGEVEKYDGLLADVEAEPREQDPAQGDAAPETGGDEAGAGATCRSPVASARSRQGASGSGRTIALLLKEGDGPASDRDLGADWAWE